MNSKLQEAIEFAAEAHAGQVRKGTDIPYIVHPIEVMKIVCGITADEIVRIAAVLHDTIEDTDATPDEICSLFGEKVIFLVSAESEDKRKEMPEEDSWKIRKQETIGHLASASAEAKIICLGDKLANMRDIARDYTELGDGLWIRFNAPEDGKGISGKKKNIGWYYRSIADALKQELGHTAAWKELDNLVHCVFNDQA